MDVKMEDRDLAPIVDRRTRSITTAIALGGMVVLAAYWCGYLIVQSIWPGHPADSWFLHVLQTQYAASLGVPMSAAAALCIVLLLQTVAGPIEIETPWLKFRGAAAPVILWILCFLVFIFAVGWLWVKSPTSV